MSAKSRIDTSGATVSSSANADPMIQEYQDLYFKMTLRSTDGKRVLSALIVSRGKT